MVQKIILALLLLTHAQISRAQEPELYPVPIEDRWGFIDAKGELKISAEFREADYFQDGLARVREGAYYGYINGTGRISIPAEYDYARSFKNQMAVAHSGDGWHALNTEGKRYLG